MSASRTARHLIALAVVAATVTSCASTQLAAVWRDPAGSPAIFKRTVVAFVTPDEALRRTVEDKLAASFPNATPSYRLAPSATAADSTAIRQRFAEEGYDGAVVMRVVNVDYTMPYATGAYWYRTPYGFGNYWGSAWNYAYDPNYYGVNQIVSIETEIYSLQSDKLVWAARSETTNPASAKKLTNSVIKHITKELRKDGMLAGLTRLLDKWSTATADE